MLSAKVLDLNSSVPSYSTWPAPLPPSICRRGWGIVSGSASRVGHGLPHYEEISLTAGGRKFLCETVFQRRHQIDRRWRCDDLSRFDKKALQLGLDQRL
jgi:hypothetical protein